MPAYLRRILASVPAHLWVRSRALAGRPAVQWVGLGAGYLAVFAGYTGLLIALFTPDVSVVVARLMLVAAVMLGVVVLATHFGRLLTRRAPAVEAARR